MQSRFGCLRVPAVPAPDAWHAGEQLTTYVVEPHSAVSATVDASELKPGDVAGIVFFRSWSPGRSFVTAANQIPAAETPGVGRARQPHAWMGVERSRTGWRVVRVDARSGMTARVQVPTGVVWLKADWDFSNNRLQCWYRADGPRPLGLGVSAPVDHGTRDEAGAVSCSVFAYSSQGRISPGEATFDSFLVAMPPARPKPATTPRSRGMSADQPRRRANK